MKGKALSEALGCLPEEMLAEAMEPAKHRRSFSWLRLAACIALIVGLFFGLQSDPDGIVTAPGLLTVTVYALNEDNQLESIRLEDSVNFPHGPIWHPGINVVPGLPISINIINSSKPINYSISLNGGSVIRSFHSMVFGYADQEDNYEQVFPSKFTVANPITLFWRDWNLDKDGNTISAEDTSYLDIVVYEDEIIVGFAVIRIERVYDNHTGCPIGYSSNLMISKSFPKLNGKYQSVSEEYVLEVIEEVKSAS